MSKKCLNMKEIFKISEILYDAMETEQEETDVNGAQTNYRLYIYLLKYCVVFSFYSLGHFCWWIEIVIFRVNPHIIGLQRWLYWIYSDYFWHCCCIWFLSSENPLVLHEKAVFKAKDWNYQGCNVRKVNCGCVYSAYILKPVLSGRNL